MLIHLSYDRLQLPRSLQNILKYVKSNRLASLARRVCEQPAYSGLMEAGELDELSLVRAFHLCRHGRLDWVDGDRT